MSAELVASSCLSWVCQARSVTALVWDRSTASTTSSVSLHVISSTLLLEATASRRSSCTDHSEQTTSHFDCLASLSTRLAGLARSTMAKQRRPARRARLEVELMLMLVQDTRSLWGKTPTSILP